MGGNYLAALFKTGGNSTPEKNPRAVNLMKGYCITAFELN